jgi:N-acetylmuramic acid 6-phosphate (MurNAc-6-P) etherase
VLNFAPGCLIAQPHYLLFHESLKLASPIKRSITETPNCLTSEIDLASPIEIVRLLRAADAQIFAGYGGEIGMSDPELLTQMARLADVAAAVLRKPTGRVILSGAGTSGRLAMFVARAFNRVFATKKNPEPFRYTIAGTDLALIQAQEGAEDDPAQGAADLEAAAAGSEEVFFVGITCGLSAPYVAGQIVSMLEGKVAGHAVLLGFNPARLARDAKVEGWDRTFYGVLDEALNAPNFDLLNPVVGPEPITGSTRMKSGSATKILLEVLFSAARAAGDEPDADPEERQSALAYVIRILFNEYEAAIREAYMPTEEIAELVDAGADALNSGGRIFYLGNTAPITVSGGCGHDHDEDEEHDHDHMPDATLYTEAGILGLIDASECPPTYGARFEDVRGYLEGGWAGLLDSGADYSDRGAHFQIGIVDFKNQTLPTLGKNDLVVFLGPFEGRDDLVEQIHEKGARTGAVVMPQVGSAPAVELVVPITPPLTSINAGPGGEPVLFEGPPQLAIKLILNALTTGAHVLNGKVYGNRMIDLRISNNKLYYRAISIIGDLTGADEETARMALLRSVYRTDVVEKEKSNAPVSDHIEASKDVPKLVPTALLIATGKFTWQQAADALAADPVVRHAISAHVK